MKNVVKTILTVSPMLVLLSGCSIYTQDDMDEMKEKYEAEIADYKDDIEDYKDEIADYKEQIADYEAQGTVSVPDDNNGGTASATPNSTGEVSEEAYNSVIDDYVDVYGHSDINYSVIDFNGDSYPDFYIYDNYYGTVNVYVMESDGAIEQVVYDATASQAYYYEGMGVLSLFNSWNGGGDEGSYGEDYYLVSETDTYEYGREGDFGYEYNATYDEEGDWTGTGETTFYSFGSSVTEDEVYDTMTLYGVSPYEAGDSRVEDGCSGYIAMD